MLIQFN